MIDFYNSGYDDVNTKILYQEGAHITHVLSYTASGPSREVSFISLVDISAGGDYASQQGERVYDITLSENCAISLANHRRLV